MPDSSTALRGHGRRCWSCAEEEAWYGARALHAARERLRVARQNALDRRRRAQNALAAGQEMFAHGLLDAAEAHEVAAREAETVVAELEERCRALLQAAEAVVRSACEEDLLTGDDGRCDPCCRRAA